MCGTNSKSLGVPCKFSTPLMETNPIGLLRLACLNILYVCMYVCMYVHRKTEELKSIIMLHSPLYQDQPRSLSTVSALRHVRCASPLVNLRQEVVERERLPWVALQPAT